MFSAMHGSSVAHAHAGAHGVHVKVDSDPGPFQAEFIMKSLLYGPCAHAQGPSGFWQGTQVQGRWRLASRIRCNTSVCLDVPRTCERARENQHHHHREEHLTGRGVFEKERTAFFANNIPITTQRQCRHATQRETTHRHNRHSAQTHDTETQGGLTTHTRNGNGHLKTRNTHIAHSTQTNTACIRHPRNA